MPPHSRRPSSPICPGLIYDRHSWQILWFGVTTHPTAEWIANQITEACGWEQVPQYLIRDRDGAYGEVFIRRLLSMGIRDRPTSPRSPWQNGYAERLIGSIRRECVDHIVVFGERHLRHVLLLYMNYYNDTRTHLSLNKDAPSSRAAEAVGRIVCHPILGGLHHQYARIGARRCSSLYPAGPKYPSGQSNFNAFIRSAYLSCFRRVMPSVHDGESRWFAPDSCRARFCS